MRWIGLDLSQWEKSGYRPKDQIVRGTFRTTLTVHDAKGRMEIRLTAVNRYRLTVNGCTILHGPARAARMQCYLDTVDLSGMLRTGENRIEILVEAYPSLPATSEHDGPQNLYRYDRGPMIAAASECFPEISQADAWTIIPDAGYTPNMQFPLLAGPTERDDLRKTMRADGVMAKDLGEAGSNPWGEILLPSVLDKPIPNMLRQKKKFRSMQMLHTDAGETQSMVLEAESLTTALPAFEFTGGIGAEVRILYAESYVIEEDGKLRKRKRSDRNGILSGIEDVIVLSGKTVRWEPLWFRAFRYIQVTVTAGSEPADLKPLGYTEIRYPLEGRTVITSPEKWVDRLYEISRRTLENCMHDSYEDCPYYEQLQYLMDTRLEAVYTHRLSGDVRLSRQAIRLFAASQTPSGFLQARYPCAKEQIIPEFSLFFLEMLLDDYEQTGDRDFARRYLPSTYGIVQAFMDHIGTNGMFGQIGYWEFADWTEAWADTHGTPTAAVKEQSALHNLHFAYAVKCLSDLLEMLGETNHAHEMRLIAGRVATAVHHECYDRARQMYKEGKTTEQFSQHAQIWAVLCGIAEGKIARNALEHALNDPDVIPCSFCMQFYLFRALQKAGMYEKTLPLWEQWKGLIEDDLTTIPENPGQPRSDCHGWGAVPLYEFPAVWLGVNPGTPGWKTIRITPQTELIRNCSGTCHTPAGPVFVGWARKGESLIHLWIRSPKGTETEVCLPDGRQVGLQDGCFDGDIQMADRT